jgi:cytochrome c peroxidase
MYFFPLSCLNSFAVNLSLCLSGQSFFSNSEISASKNVSCALCHSPNHQFSDSRPRPIARQVFANTSKTPRLLNLSEGPFFYNARAPTLEHQTFWPLFNKHELNASPSSLKAFGGVSFLSQALAEFRRSIKSSETKWDRYQDNLESISAEENKGKQTFFGKGNCSTCHSTTTFRGVKTFALKYSHSALKNAGETLETKEYTYLNDAIEIKRNGVLIKSLPTGLRSVSTVPFLGRFATHKKLGEYLPYHVNQFSESLFLSKNDFLELEAFLNIL